MAAALKRERKIVAGQGAGGARRSTLQGKHDYVIPALLVAARCAGATRCPNIKFGVGPRSGCRMRRGFSLQSACGTHNLHSQTCADSLSNRMEL